MTTIKGCDTCNKNTMSLLLLRPSPVATAGELVPCGANVVVSDLSIMNGLLPARLPTESRFALRLMRAGYVHLYIANPPAGVKHWLVWRVTDQADVVPQNNALFNQPAVSAVCTRDGHNAMGMKLINIPQAHKIDEVWIAYSANLWNEKLKEKNKANPTTMQCISLSSGSVNTFKPTEENLKRKILEASMLNLSIDKAVDHDFVFNSVAKQVSDLVQQMALAAACHPKTKGKELAIVLRDSVGLTAELNALRLRRHELVKKELEKPENSHPLNSSNALMGLKRVMLDANLLDSYEQVSPLRTKAKFQAESWPSGAEWQALTPEDRQLLIKLASGSILLQPYKAAFSRADIGRVIYEDHNERAAAWAKKQTDATWSAISPHYDDTARVKWLKQFDEKIKAAHYEPLAKFEDDWRAAADDMQTMAYFKEHFDPEDPNDPLKLHSPGKVYGQENQYINTPAPITNGAALDTYLKLLDKPITDDTAIILRSLAGNQQSIIALVNTQLSGDSGADSKDGGGLRDKTYDFVKGLRSEVKALHQYSWLSNTLAAFSVGQLTALSSATLSAISRNTNVSGALFHKLQTLQNLWGMQQALDLIAMQGALTGAAPKMPVLITMRVDIDEALAVMNARKGQGIDVSKSRIKQLRRTHSKIALTLLTDTDSIKTAQGDLKTLSNDASTGQVKMGGSATTSAAASAGSTIILSEEHFMRLYASQSNLGGRAANAIRLSLTKGSGADIRAIAMGADGRLAIGSVVVQSIGLYYGITGFLKASGEGNTQGMRDACYGLYDSAAGGLSGLMEIWSVAVSARTIANAASAEAGKSAVAKSIGLGAMRLATNIAGIAGGAINTMASLDKATDAIALGDKKIAALFNGSAAMFAGLTVTATLTTIGTGAEMLAVRSVGGAAVEAVAIRLGAGGVASLLGISITGWGLIFLGLGIGAQVTAIALTPTPMQRWVGRSYFGRDSSFFSANSKRDDMFKKGDWKAELEGLQAALKEAGAQVPETEAPSPKTQVTQ